MRIRYRVGIGFILLNHLFFSGKTSTNIRLFSNLLNVLRPLRSAGLVRRGVALSYLSIFLSRSLSTDDKLKLSVHHYSFLQKVFSDGQLKALFGRGLEFYTEHSNGSLLNISLVHDPGYVYEGPCDLLFEVNGETHAKLSFMAAPGNIFGLPDETVFYISCMQKKHSDVEGINKITHVNHIHPVTMLLNVLKAFSAAKGISHCVAVSAKDQLSYIETLGNYDHFVNLYDDFWVSKGGSPLNRDYLLPLPLVQKPILEVKQTHRNRVRKKRAKLQEVYDEVYSRFK